METSYISLILLFFGKVKKLEKVNQISQFPI
jgi:hypothetical protein